MSVEVHGEIVKEVIKNSKSLEQLADTLRSFSKASEDADLIDQITDLVDRGLDDEAVPLVNQVSENVRNVLFGLLRDHMSKRDQDRTRMSGISEEKTRFGRFTSPDERTSIGTATMPDDLTEPGQIAA